MRKFIIVLALLLLPGALFAQGRPDLGALRHNVDETLTAAQRNDVAALRHGYAEIHETWEAVEDGVHAQNADLYREIEDALKALQVAALANPPKVSDATAALQSLQHELTELGAAGGNAAAPSGDPRQAVRQLNLVAEEGLAAARAGDVATARTKFEAFEAGWSTAEDGVRDASRDAYKAIETAMGEVRVALAGDPASAPAIADAFHELEEANEAFIQGTPTQSTSAAGAQPSLATLLPKLQEAEMALERGDATTAARELDEFRAGWPDVEGVVAAKDAGVYKRSEDLMARAASDLQAQPAKATTALAAIEELKDGLQPFATAAVTYGVFDAAAILLREGLEALLIIAALLAFLQKSGNADKRRWIWLGGLAGVLVSILGAILIQLFFSSIVTGANRELIEGVTGLVAAAMLFYVSFWLHRRTHIQGWQHYLRDKTNAALATGSLFSLALLAFLAVFREGAETTLFYLGIAPSISQRDLLVGLLSATAILAVVGVAIIVLGRRIPLRPFFTITSLLIFYLGFKFIGAGIHALQVARILPASTSTYLPSIDLIGLYPTWESTLLQLVTVMVAVGVVLWLNRRRPNQERIGGATA